MLDKLLDDYERHGRRLLEPAFWLMAVYRFGRFSNELQGPSRKIGSAVYGTLLIAEEIFLSAVVERTTPIGDGLRIIGAEGVRISPRATVGARVTIMHGVTIGVSTTRPGAPTIGDDVIIGAGAKIFGPIVIGRGARIGANSLVVGDVPDYAVVAGIPARIIARPQSAPEGRVVETAAPLD